MNILRKVALSLMAAVFSACLFGLAAAQVGQATIRNRETVKSWFDKSGFHDKITDVILESAKKEAANSEIQINDPGIQSVAKQAFNPELIKNSINAILDGTYSWLESDNKDLDFKVDLTGARQQLIDGLGSYVATRTASLPVCQSVEESVNFDGFNSSCRPAQLTPEQAGELAKENISKQEFLKNPVLTADSIKLGPEGSTAATSLKNSKEVETARTAYRLSSQLPILLAIIAALMALGIVLWSSTKLKGIRRVSVILLVNGIVLLAFYLLIGAIYTAASNQIHMEDTFNVKTELIKDFAKVVLDSAKSVLVWYIVAYCTLGLAGVILTFIIAKRDQTSTLIEDSDKSDEINTDEIEQLMKLSSNETKDNKKEEKDSRPNKLS